MQNLFHSVIERLPHLRQPVAFEPVLSDSDELTEAIDNDVHLHENDWQLSDSLDSTQLAMFWDDVLAELGPDKTED